MCNPAVIFAVSAIVSGASKYQDSQNQAALDKAQAQLRDMQAGDALLRGQSEQGLVNAKTGQTVAEQSLAFSTAGVDASVGTPVEVASQTTMLGRLEALNAENNAIREAWGYSTEADTLRSKAKAEVQRGRNELASSIIGAAATAYSGYSKANSGKTSLATSGTG